MALQIKLAESPRDRRRALGFIRRHVRRLYGGIPPPSQIILFAESEGRICGTMALDFSEAEASFPLEKIYRVDKAQTPWSFERERIAQFSKWWATRSGLGVHLMRAAHLYALSQGKNFGLVEVKPPILSRVGEFGMTLVEVEGATLQIQGVSTRGEGYYAIPPPPRLYMFDIRVNAEALTRYVELSEGI